MRAISRRRFVSGSAFTAGLASASLLFPAITRAAPVTRYDLTTSEGQANLKIYADAVRKMMALAEGEPRGWLFQWYTHAVRDDRSKTSEIGRIYGSASSANKQLASATWNTCEAHFSDREDYFLPWHRMYLLCLEQIVRNVTGQESFTLPYWNYTDSSQRVLPQQFSQQNDPVWGSLYRPDRNPGINSGTPIDQVQGASSFSLDAMKSTSYSATTSDAGFCQNLDNDPHGIVHVDIGNEVGMGQIPWAANDPIFWMHHCNLDRIWASWNKTGGTNPSLTGTYTFADGDGSKVQLDVAKFLDTAPLGYQYDNYLSRPADSPAFSISDRLRDAVVRARTGETTGGPIALGATPTTVALASRQPNTPQANGLSATLDALPLATHFILRLENVQAKAAPGVGYDVYYGLPEGQPPNRSNPAYVGSLSFFGVAAHAMAGMAMPEIQRTYSFYITRPVQNALNATPQTAAKVTLVPNGTPKESAAPTIGSISLISA